MTSPSPNPIARIANSDAESTVDIAAALLRDATDGTNLTEALPVLQKAIRRWESRSRHDATCNSVEIDEAEKAERAARALCEVVIAHGLTQRDEALLLELLLTTEHMYNPNLFVSSAIALCGKDHDISLALAVLIDALSADDPDQCSRVARTLDKFTGTPRSVQRNFMAHLDPLLLSAMQAVLTDSLEVVRRSVSRLLATHHTHRASWSDIAALLDSPDAAVRLGTTQALHSAPLGGQDISPALPRLRELCSDTDNDVVRNAQRAIACFEKYPVRL